METKKKTIIIQLKKGKSARHVIFEIELRPLGQTSQDFETLEEVKPDAPVLSICGAYRLGGCPCQTIDTIKGYRSRVKAKDLEMFDFIIDTWEAYHLNDMHGGTKQQEAILHAVGLEKFATDYSACCAKLDSLDLLEDRGYKFGHGWLYQPIDSETLAKLDEIMQ